MNELQVRDYKDSDSNRCRDIHDLARPIELQGSCDPRAFVPLANDAKDLAEYQRCLLYPSDAADDPLCVDLGGRRIINKLNTSYTIYSTHTPQLLL